MEKVISDYLQCCPVFSKAQLLRFELLGARLGWVDVPTAEFLCTLDPRFNLVDQALQLAMDASTVEQILTDAAYAMRGNGMIHGWRDEKYQVFSPDPSGNPNLSCPLFKLERAAFRRFGFTSQAVHINGYTSEGNLWIGRRASSKPIDPHRLDNLSAGGISAGESSEECLVRELYEEASIPAWLAATAQYSGLIRTIRNEHDGTHDEVLLTYDLCLPEDFVPFNTDGEVAEFLLLTPDEVARRLHEFTWDAGSVSAHFLQRQLH